MASEPLGAHRYTVPDWKTGRLVKGLDLNSVLEKGTEFFCCRKGEHDVKKTEPPNSETIRVGLYLSKELDRYLDLLRFQQNISRSEIVEKALRQHFCLAEKSN